MIPVVPITTAVLLIEAIFKFSREDSGDVKSITTFASLINATGFDSTSLKELISENGGDSQIIPTDVTKEKDVKKLYSSIDIDNVDVVVNNAGFGVFNKIQPTTIKDWDNQLNTNLRGSFLITK